MVPREFAPSAVAAPIFVVALLVVAAAPLAVVVAAPAPPSIAPPMASVRLSVLAVVAEVLPLDAPPDLTLVGLSQPCLRPVLALTMAPHR